MNDLDYAKMIEIPVTTSEISVKKARKFRRRRPETLKRELIEKLNGEPAEEVKEGETAAEAETLPFENTVEVITKKEERKRLKGKFKFDIVAAQVAVIVVLALTIMLTNIFWQDSGINTLVRSVFASGKTTEQDVTYKEFSPVVPNYSSATIDGGVMTFAAGGSIYSMCDGVVTNVAENAGKYDISLKFSPSFSAVISGAEYAYYGLGDSVYKSVPVCYSSGEVKVYLYDNGKLLTDYTLDGGKIIWQS